VFFQAPLIGSAQPVQRFVPSAACGKVFYVHLFDGACQQQQASMPFTHLQHYAEVAPRMIQK
jgi:hypothetical protein